MAYKRYLNDIFAKIDNQPSVFKSAVDLAQLNGTTLSVETGDYVEKLALNCPIVDNGRMVTMLSYQKAIDIIGYSGRGLVTGLDSNGAKRALSDSDKKAPDFGRNLLTAKEYDLYVLLDDEAVLKSVAKNNLQQLVEDVSSKQIGSDMGEIGLFGDTSISYATDKELHAGDGWIKKAGHKLYGIESATAAKDYDFNALATTDMVIDMFQAMIDKLPEQYQGDPSKLAFYVAPKVARAYRRWLAERNTALGDTAVASNAPIFYEGIEVISVYQLGLTNGSAVSGGNAALLSYKENFVTGVFVDVEIETQRDITARATKMVAATWFDVHYEISDAAVVALINQKKPTA